MHHNVKAKNRFVLQKQLCKFIKNEKTTLVFTITHHLQITQRHTLKEKESHK